MSTLIYIILSTLIISICVWIAIFFVFIKKDWLNKIVVFLVSLSAGSLMAGAFLHLLPEASEMIELETVFLVFLASFIVFFFIEKVIHWRHCHKTECSVHSFGYMNLLGDSVHNFLDGLIIAGAFLIDIKLGIATTIAVALHEIPQEVGDFGVLVFAGFARKKALIINYLIALSVVFGGIVGYFVFSRIEFLLPYIMAFAAGGFVYISASDLIPELKKESKLGKSIISILIFVLGVLIMYFQH